jgi:hypothetical protein
MIKLPDSISITWHIDDVISRAAGRGIHRISKRTAREVLRRIKEGHDGNEGISWYTIDNGLDDVLGETT